MKESEVYVLYVCSGADIIKFRENIKLKIKSKKDRLSSYICGKSRGQYDSLRFKFRKENSKG